LCKKCDDIITRAGSGHHLRPDKIKSGAPYFGKCVPVRPLSLPEFLRLCLLSRSLLFVVCFGKFSLSDIPVRNNQTASDRASAVAKVPSVRTGTDFPKYGAPGSILSGRKWWLLPSHVTISSHFLHSEVSPLQISLQYPH